MFVVKGSKCGVILFEDRCVVFVDEVLEICLELLCVIVVVFFEVLVEIYL